ncbi:MAG: homing endonuclease associated repeat-containing protein [Gaiellaceae bacterium]
MVAERRTPKRRFEDDRLEMVWAALQTLDVGLRYVVLRELATELNQERVEPRSAQGRIRAAVLSLNHAADVLGEAPTQSTYRELRELHPELQLMSDTTVRRLLGGIPWRDCLRRAFIAAPTEGDFVKQATGEAYSEEEVLQAVRECVADRGGSVPTFNDYLAWVLDPEVTARSGRRPRSLSVFARFGGFRACLVRAGLAVEARQRVDKAGRVVPLHRGYTTDEMSEAVRSVARELGRTPQSSDYRDAREATARTARAGGGIPTALPSLTTLVERFGSWAAVIEEAGLTPLEPRRRPVRRPVYATDEMLNWLRRAWVEIGAPLSPAAYERWRRRLLDEARGSDTHVHIPSCDAIARAFNGWRNARAQAVPSDPR